MKELPIDPNELDEYFTLNDIVEELNVSYKQLLRWADKHRNNGFPEPITLGKYRLYKKTQVIAWVTLWQKVNRNLGGPKLKARGK